MASLIVIKWGIPSMSSQERTPRQDPFAQVLYEAQFLIIRGWCEAISHFSFSQSLTFSVGCAPGHGPHPPHSNNLMGMPRFHIAFPYPPVPPYSPWVCDHGSTVWYEGPLAEASLFLPPWLARLPPACAPEVADTSLFLPP